MRLESIQQARYHWAGVGTHCAIAQRMCYSLVFASWLVLNLLACEVDKLPPSDTNKTAAPPDILKESWKAYVSHFVQEDGRVIDYKGGSISTSEGQAYAMLRAVWMQDRAIFDKTYTWARNNLNTGIRNDHLWAWKWGKDSKGKWQVLDQAFASDADQDAALALILASKIWNDDKYLNLAQAILSDLWHVGTLRVAGRRYLLAGDSLCQGKICRLNPSYYAPYAYRIFTKFDRSRNWTELIDSSYFLLETVSRLTSTHLPTDWIRLNRETGRLSLGTEKDSFFSYDAFRVYWRVALDKELFKDPRAEKYLSQSLIWIANEWGEKQKLPAAISGSAKPQAEYESPEMLAGLMPALQSLKPSTAAAMNQRLQSAYSQGVWADKDSYYIQNWAWFGTALYQKYLRPFEKVR